MKGQAVYQNGVRPSRLNIEGENRNDVLIEHQQSRNDWIRGQFL